MAETRAVVIDVGPLAYERNWFGWPVRRCKPGDKVMVSKYSGAIVVGPLDGVLYRTINFADVYAQIEAEDETQELHYDVPGTRDRRNLDEVMEEA